MSPRLYLIDGHALAYRAYFALSGGGTMWNPVMAGVPSDVEEMLQIILGVPGAKPSKPIAKAEVLARFAAFRREIKARGKQIDEWGAAAGLGREAALKSLARAEKEFGLLLSSTAGLGAKARREALAYGMRQADDVKAFGE